MKYRREKKKIKKPRVSIKMNTGTRVQKNAKKVIHRKSKYKNGINIKRVDIKEKVSEILKKAGEIDLKEFAKKLANFHNYSLCNYFMIMIQKPTASQCAGFYAWKKLGRYIKKGEKGIMILAPREYIPREIRQDDTLTDEQKEQQKRVCFVSAYVFDISQTDGKELPPTTEVEKCNVSYQSLKTKVEKKYPVIEEAMEYLKSGHTNGKEIFLNSIKTEQEKVCVLLHELAHIELEHAGISNQVENPLTKKQKETEAELLAYITASGMGIEYKAENYLAYYKTKLNWDLLNRLNKGYSKMKKLIAVV